MTERTVHEYDVHVHGYRSWAVFGMVGGAVTSVAANVAHVFVPPVHAKHGWQPEPGAVLAAVVWPLMLLGASEVLARKRWASQRVRVIGGLAVFVVAAVAAVISYQHLYALLIHYGESQLSAHIGPLGIDGLMLVCSVALVAKDAPDTPADTPVDTVPDTPADTAPDTWSRTLASTPVLAASTLPASSAGTATVTVRVPGEEATAAPTVHASTDTQLLEVLAERLRSTGTRTLRGAMAELGCGQPRARRVLAIAFPPDT